MAEYVKTLERRGDANDIAIRNHDFAFVEGKYAYAAIIEAAVLTVKGELIYNTTQGIPYLDTAFYSTNRLSQWARRVQDRIKEFSFVKGITSFTYEFDSTASKVSYKAVIETDEGTVTIEE